MELARKRRKTKESQYTKLVLMNTDFDKLVEVLNTKRNRLQQGTIRRQRLG